MAGCSSAAAAAAHQQVVSGGIVWLQKIGAGSFGVVYKALVQGHTCAVKRMQQDVQPKTLQRFIQECKIMSSVIHDNIVQCLGSCFLDQPILIMELMDCNLREFLKSPRLYYIQVDIVLNILQAIAYLHRESIVHRDLSSANVLMKGNIAKVTDFGMSKLLDLSTINLLDLTRCPGTKHYMPPEALANPPDYNHKIDIFSVGVLIVQILTGKMPNPIDQVFNPNFKGIRQCSNEIERRADHIGECDDRNPLKKLALLCLHNDKNDRPDAAALCAEVFKMQEQDMYLYDKLAGTQGMQLAMQCNIVQVVNEQAVKIQESERTISLLNKAREQGEHEILQLNTKVAALQQSEKHKDQQVKDLQHRVTNLEVQIQQYIVNAQDYVQKMFSESDGEKKQLQAENQQLQAADSMHQAKIVELEQSLSSVSLCSFNQRDSLSDSQLSQRLPSSLVFEEASSTIKAMHRWSSAVTHKKAVYVIPARTQEIYKYFDYSWTLHAKCQARNSTLTFVNDMLVTVGGQLYSKNGIVYTNLLYTYIDSGRIWNDKSLPPMQTKRDNVIAVTNGKALIVAGGCAIVTSGGRKYPASSNPLRTVEVLYLETATWQYVSELPFPLYHASVTICGDRIFILGGTTGFKSTRSKLPSSPGTRSATREKEVPGNEKSVLTCQLTNLVLSGFRGPSEWREIKQVPYSKSTCVTFKGSLLAIGGLQPDNSPSDKVFYYDEDSDSWIDYGCLKVARVRCFAAVLSNKLFVIGGMSGSTPHKSVEIGTSS